VDAKLEYQNKKSMKSRNENVSLVTVTGLGFFRRMAGDISYAIAEAAGRWLPTSTSEPVLLEE
jgi:hypothetical protein